MVAVHTKLTVNLAEPAALALDQVAKLTKDTRTDCVNRALVLYDVVHQHQAKGGQLFLRHPGQDEVELIRIL